MEGGCPKCGSEDIDLWLGGLGAAMARAWVAGAARAWYHCNECNYLGPMRLERRASTSNDYAG